jgi:hypothetical protein
MDRMETICPCSGRTPFNTLGIEVAIGKKLKLTTLHEEELEVKEMDLFVCLSFSFSASSISSRIWR